MILRGKRQPEQHSYSFVLVDAEVRRSIDVAEVEAASQMGEPVRKADRRKAENVTAFQKTVRTVDWHFVEIAADRVLGGQRQTACRVPGQIAAEPVGDEVVVRGEKREVEVA